MRAIQIIPLAIFFVIGFLTSELFASFAEQPGITGSATYGEQLSPSDIVSQDKIHVLNDKIIIDIDNAQWAQFTDTNSMDPLFDKGANALQIVPLKPEQISEGDIISYASNEGVIIHRVVQTGVDEQGWYAITKGDNNPEVDPGKVRFVNVKKLLIGIIY